MNKVYDISPNDDLSDIARKWYLRLEEYPGDIETMEHFEQWVTAHPSHRDAFDKVVSFWAHIDSLPEINELRETGATLPSATPSTQPGGSVIDFEPIKRTVSHLEKWQKWQKIAAAAVLLVICSALVNFYLSYVPEGTYQTATGEQKTIHLADGSTVYLNTASKLKVEYSENNRIIQLIRGEARFDVAKDAKRPFIVATAQGSVRAVGTSFNIYDNDETVEIIVFEGTIAVNKDNDRLSELNNVDNSMQDALLITEGKRIVAFDQHLGKIRPVSDFELSQKNAWRNGKAIFRGQKLSAVIREMSRYTNKQIVISDDVLEEMEMGGAFDINDLNAFLNAIEDTFPVRVIRFTPYLAVIVNT